MDSFIQLTSQRINELIWTIIQLQDNFLKKTEEVDINIDSFPFQLVTNLPVTMESQLVVLPFNCSFILDGDIKYLFNPGKPNISM